jgi:lipopolysaccharide biosynthesis regulator YciM
MLSRLLILAVSSMVVLAVAIPDADAQRRNRNQDEQGSNAENRTMSAAIGEPVLAAQECLDAENFSCVINTLSPLLSGEINSFERFVILRMRGVAYYSQDRTEQAINDFLGAVNTGIATTDEEVQLRLNVGQLYIITERYSEGIRQMEMAVQAGAELTPNLALMLAQAYAQAERYSEGLRYAEMQYNTASPRERRNYDMLLFYYQQLNRVSDQLRLISDMVERWPADRNIWTSLVALMAQTNNESGAFEANKLMYLNGMLNEERELVRLAQYYSYFEYPYRGAVILEREMNSGRVERSRQNLEILANMWRQAREYERAIPVLEAVARQGNGEDYLRLAEALYQENRLAEAENAFETAISRGGLNRPGDAIALLGTVRYEQDNRQGALQAFRQCGQYSYSRRTCNGWVEFITNEINAANERAALRVRVNTEECRNTVREAINLVTITGNESDFDEEGNAIITVPERCQEFFNERGEQIGGYGYTASAEEEDEADGADAG